ncbi:MAG: 16S rRNA (cytosine(967)-C(5))-methyltransferase [Clostridium sp. 27_14]|nr:MAG: 16S rRNA (cytosine(967)-C(5))-methyltransferase [Clostridium sp. 27_14]
MDKVRELALKVLYKIDKEEAYSNIALNEIINANREKLTPKDIGLISEIIYGVTTWKLTLDVIIIKHSKIKMKKISTWVLNILRMGIYQILFLDKIPQSAAVNESVNLAKRYGHKSSANFVNAVLRKVSMVDYAELFKIENPIERISKTTSMPVWIIEELLKDKDYNINNVRKICGNLVQRPNITIRRNNLKINKEEFEKQLKERNINFTEIEENKEFYIVEKIKNIENLDMFQKGYFTVQDLSAGMSAYMLEPKENEYILDACSAPGGKTTYIAELMNNKGKILAWDLYEARTNLIKENAQRLGINIINTETNDATKYKAEYNEKFDKILLDVPCMGIGVIKRKPDIKWHRKPEDLKVISKVQYEILENCSKYVKKGGTIIYSTCSILEKENHGIIQKFLEKNPIYTTTEIKIEPTEKQDGFYIAKLIKK